MWRTRVYCDCGAEYFCYNVTAGKTTVYYYLCKDCRQKGPWDALARRHLARKSGRAFR